MDMWRFHPQSIWVAVVLAFQVVRLVASMWTSPRLHSQVMVPFSTYGMRIAASLQVLLGPQWSPSAFSLGCLFRTYPAFDVAFFLSTLGIWRVNAFFEVTYFVWTTFALVTLAVWHGDRFPGGVNLPWLVTTRLLVLLANLYLARACGRFGLGRRGAGRVLAGASGGSQLPGASGPVASGSKGHDGGGGKLGSQPQAGCGGGKAAGGEEDGDEPAASGSRAAKLADIHGDSGGGGDGEIGQESATVAPLRPAQTVHSEPTKQEGSAEQRQPQPAKASPAGQPAVALAAAPAEHPLGAAYAKHLLRVPLPYRSAVQRRSVRMKIPWAEPEDLAPDFKDRLAALASENGMQLAHVHVRRGCVELMLVLAAVDPAAHGAAGSSEAAKRRPCWDLDVGAVVAALGLKDGPAGACGQQPRRTRACDKPGCADLDSWLSQIQREPDEVLTGPAAAHDAPWPSRDAGCSGPASGQAPLRILGLSPRVLLLPASAPEQHGPAGIAPGAAPVLRLQLAACGAQSAAPPAGLRGDQGDQAAAAPTLEALLRAHGATLPSRVTLRGCAPVLERLALADDCASRRASSDEVVYEYEIELPGVPTHAGPVLLDLSLGGPGAAAAAAAPAAAPRRVVLPLLAVDDAAAAAELADVAAEWPEDARGELDDLLHDLGTWSAAGAAGASPADAAAAAPLASAGGWRCIAGDISGAVGEHGDGGHGTVGAVGAHLLEYVEDVGLEATAAWMRAGAVRRAAAAGGAAATACTRSPGAATANGAPRAELTGDGDDCGACAGGDSCQPAGRASAAQAGRRRRPPWLLALLWVLGLQPTAPGDADAFHAFVDHWTATLIHTAHVVECLATLAFLVRGLRAGQSPLSAEGAVVIVGCGTGALTTLAWLVLPRAAWVRLACGARVPRYCGYVLAKAMLALAGVKPPLGAREYAAGPGMLLLEGFVLPGACLVSPRTHLIVSCFKLPINARAVLVIGAAASPLTATLTAARSELTALLTTVACYVYLRTRYEKYGAALALAASGEAGDAGPSCDGKARQGSGGKPKAE